MPLDNPFEPMIKNIGNYVTGTLYSQGTIPPINIDNYEGLAVASPADTHLLAAKDPVINEVAVGMSGNLIGSNVVTGTPPLQLPNSAGYPLQWWQVNLSPYQEGTGDPSPNNVRPIHGTDKVTVWTGGQNLFQTTAESKTENGVTWTVNADGSISISGTANDYTDFLLGDSAIDYRWGTITISGITNATNIAWGAIRLLDDNDTTVYTISSGGYFQSITVDLTPYPTAKKIRMVVKRNNNTIVSGTIMPMVNLGSAVLPFVPYIPISQTSITLLQTVYTGTVGSDGGEATWGNIASYNGETLPGEWISSMDVYAEGTTPTIGAQVVYELATPTTFTVPSVTIPTPQGTATAWVTAEDGTVESMEVMYIGKA